MGPEALNDAKGVVCRPEGEAFQFLNSEKRDYILT